MSGPVPTKLTIKPRIGVDRTCSPMGGVEWLCKLLDIKDKNVTDITLTVSVRHVPRVSVTYLAYEDVDHEEPTVMVKRLAAVQDDVA